MEPPAGKPGFLRNVLLRVLLFGLFVIAVRFAYVVTIAGESCDLGDFCFFRLPENFSFVIAGAGAGSGIPAIAIADTVRSSRTVGPNRRDLYTSKDWIKAVNFYSSVFQDLISEGYLAPASKVLCVETQFGQDVFALKEIGVADAVGIFKKASKPLVVNGEGHRIPFDDDTFDFVFSGWGALETSLRPAGFAAEIARTLKPEGFFAVHVKAKDTYSFNSFIDLFSSFKFVKSRDLEGFNSSTPYIREIVMMKEIGTLDLQLKKPDGAASNKCNVPGYKQELVRIAEPLITEEPLKPWLTLKRNVKNIKYLPSMADISFKDRYVYIDVGARSYGSSIGSWFRKQYPKQNKTFHVYAIEADRTFHEEYKTKKGVSLMPYAAWVRNETLFFEIHRDPGQKADAKGRGMGRIQPVQLSSSFDGQVDKIQGFDFADWLKNTVTERDFVVMKMDVEGTEFQLIPRLFETGAICLIDEIFLECHYNRWQRCCPGERTPKYETTYEQCLDLFTSLRQSGVLVHQWF